MPPQRCPLRRRARTGQVPRGTLALEVGDESVAGQAVTAPVRRGSPARLAKRHRDPRTFTLVVFDPESLANEPRADRATRRIDGRTAPNRMQTRTSTALPFGCPIFDLQGFRSHSGVQALCLKIVVSPVRVRVSPSTKSCTCLALGCELSRRRDSSEVALLAFSGLFSRPLVGAPPPGAWRAGSFRRDASGARLRTMNLDLEALETSFDIVAPHGDELVDVFYVRLFEAAPAVRPRSPTPTSAAGTIARRSTQRLAQQHQRGEQHRLLRSGSLLRSRRPRSGPGARSRTTPTSSAARPRSLRTTARRRDQARSG